MKNIKHMIIAAVAALSLSSQAEAAAFGCGPEQIYILTQTDNGFVYVGTYSYGTFQLCNVSAAAGSVSTDTCKTWFSQLLTAWTLKKNVRMLFDLGNPVNAGMAAPYCSGSNFDYKLRQPFWLELHP